MDPAIPRAAGRQRSLRLTNASAAPADGPLSSTHRTGAAVDISKRGLTNPELMWLRTVLDRLERRRLVHAVEEFGEPHFHVFVRERYLGYAGRLPSPLLLGGC